MRQLAETSREDRRSRTSATSRDARTRHITGNQVVQRLLRGADASGQTPPTSDVGRALQMQASPTVGGATATAGRGSTATVEEDEEGLLVQTAPAGSGGDREIALSRYLDRTSGGGRSLDGATQGRMSSAFGYDFGSVRIHDDASAQLAARSIGANAFTSGGDIYFGRGRYRPGTAGGDRLLAHELTHVVQQASGLRSGAPAGSLTISRPGDVHERQADRVADEVATSLRSAPERSSSGSDAPGGGQGPARTSVADGTLQRKADGVPDVQTDAGLTVSIVGVLVSAGTWAAGTGGRNPMTVDPRLERIAEPSAERERYRTTHPFRSKSWSFFEGLWEGATPISLDRRWMVDLRWQHNGAELTDVHLKQGWRDFSPWDDTHARLIMVDNQASTKRIGFRCEFEWDPALPGHGVFSCDGWISADGSGKRTDWRFHDY